jgi:hypothetical protein
MKELKQVEFESGIRFEAIFTDGKLEYVNVISPSRKLPLQPGELSGMLAWLESICGVADSYSEKGNKLGNGSTREVQNPSDGLHGLRATPNLENRAATKLSDDRALLADTVIEDRSANIPVDVKVRFTKG